MFRNRKPNKLTEDDCPFTYEYTAMASVPGIKLPQQTKNDIQFYAFPHLGSEVILTRDIDQYFLHLDRSAALGSLLLSAFRGTSRFGKLSVLLHKLEIQLFGAEKVFKRRLAREANLIKEERKKEMGSLDCFIVYRARGKTIEDIRTHATRKFAEIGFGIDAFSIAPYRELHSRAFHSSITAISLALENVNGSSDIHFLSDGIHMVNKHGLLLYSRTVKMGAVSVVSTQLQNDDNLKLASSYLPVMAKDRQLETAISLFVESQRKDSDTLRKFISSWSALELLVNRISKLIRKQWEEVLESEKKLPYWDRELKGVLPKDYRMRDRFYSIACFLNAESADKDINKFTNINQIRSKYYHQGNVDIEALPVEESQKLFRKYLVLGLDVLRKENGKRKMGTG